MTLTINFPEEDLEAISAKAREQGVSAEQYVRQVVKHNLQRVRQPISARIRQIWSDMPEDVRAKLPADGASQIDHYVYGLPKREQ
jgi:hypothetical protein